MQNGHLSIEEIEQLSQQKGPAEDRSHIANCRQCQTLLESYRAVGAQLEQLASVRIGARITMNCPDERVWFDVAAGTIATEESFKHVQHAAECDKCGPKLKSATDMFADTVSAEEEQVISSIPSANREAQKKLAARLAAPTETKPASKLKKGTKERRGFFSWRLPGLVFAGLAITAFLGFESYRYFEIQEISQAINETYKTVRPTLYRVAGVPYKDSSSMVRGPSRSSYIEVPDWLNQPVLAAKAAFLAHDWSAAATALEKAPKSAEVLNDLAVAYAMLAENPHNDDLYRKALGFADDAVQSDPIAYFNRGLILEQLGHRSEAIASFQKFIEKEPDPGWKGEASAKLRDLQKPQ